MDQNELLRTKHSLLYRHYWFFRHVLKAPSWQRYCIIVLIIGIIISSWFIYWYIPHHEQAVLYKQHLEARQQQQILRECLQQQLKSLSTTPLQGLSISSGIAELIALAEQQNITIASYTPASSYVHTNVPSGIRLSTISFAMHSIDYAHLVSFLTQMTTTYPTIEIVDMLVKKSECGLTIRMQLQLITSTYETSKVAHSPASSYPLT